MNINRTTLNGLVFAVGLGLGMPGYIGHVDGAGIAIVLMIGVWVIGYAVVRLFTPEVTAVLAAIAPVHAPVGGRRRSSYILLVGRLR